jgi:hypothetical protein
MKLREATYFSLFTALIKNLPFFVFLAFDDYIGEEKNINAASILSLLFS